MLIKDLIKINFYLFYLQLENLKRGVTSTTYLKLKSGMLWLFIHEQILAHGTESFDFNYQSDIVFCIKRFRTFLMIDISFQKHL